MLELPNQTLHPHGYMQERPHRQLLSGIFTVVKLASANNLFPPSQLSHKQLCNSEPGSKKGACK